MFMIVRIVIIPRLMQLLESPAIKLAREGFILALAKEVGYNLTNEEVLVMDLPCPTMRL
jgi:hypothetical protein